MPDHPEQDIKVYHALCPRPGLSDRIAYYARVDGAVFGQCMASSYLMSSAVNIALAVGGGRIADSRMAVRGPDNTLADATPTQCWQLRQCNGEPGMLVLSGEDTIPQLVGSHAELLACMQHKVDAELAEQAGRVESDRQRALEWQRMQAQRMHCQAQLALPGVRERIQAAHAAARTQAFVPRMARAAAGHLDGYFVDPWLDLGQEWPSHDGQAMPCVLQLDIAGLPRQASRLLGGHGLLQLFSMPGRPYADMDERTTLPAHLLRCIPMDGRGAIRHAAPAMRRAFRDAGARPNAIVDWAVHDDVDTDVLNAGLTPIAARLDLSAGELVCAGGVTRNKLLGSPLHGRPVSWPVDGQGCPMRLVYTLRHDRAGNYMGSASTYIVVDPANPANPVLVDAHD